MDRGGLREMTTLDGTEILTTWHYSSSKPHRTVSMDVNGRLLLIELGGSSALEHLLPCRRPWAALPASQKLKHTGRSKDWRGNSMSLK